MFLNLLKEKEKKGFYTLAREIALANGVVSDEEHKLMSEYAAEMQIPSEVYEFSFEDAKEIFINAEKNIKKIVIFELLGLCVVDNEFDLTEKNMLVNISEVIGVDMEYIKTAYYDLKEYNEVCNKIIRNINI